MCHCFACIVGVKGQRGLDGFPGTAGADGDPGLEGLPGRKGNAGIPGFPGVDGRPGTPGAVIRNEITVPSICHNDLNLYIHSEEANSQ